MNKRTKELDAAAEIIAKLQYGVETGQIDEVTAGTAIEAELGLIHLQLWEFEELDDLTQNYLEIYRANS